MCGIVGIWRHDNGSVNPLDLDPMLSAIVHRGPDDTGKWHGSRVALGQQRLTILDLSTRANQPMLTPDGRSVLVYNGEVYNFRELRRELEREGIQFRTSGDTEVVLQALHHWGPERSIPRFDGMFAFAYLDLREQALWLARDRLGIKPLVVCQIGSEFVFASEVKALLAHPRVQRRLDRRTMTEFLLGRPHRSNHTMFDGIGGLEPGSWWKFTDTGIKRKQYFHILDNVNVKRLAAANKENPTNFVDTFRHTLQTSVRLHLASDVPLGAICSGGVDSSLITAYAKDLQPKIQAYVADVQGGDSEAPQAERVARHLGIAVHRVPIDRQRYLQLWPHVVWHLDSPTPRFSDPALLAVTQACRADGIKVLLTGEGSDELFGGYEWQRATFELWRRLHRPWRKLFRRQFNHDQLRLRLRPACLDAKSQGSAVSAVADDRNGRRNRAASAKDSGAACVDTATRGPRVPRTMFCRSLFRSTRASASSRRNGDGRIDGNARAVSRKRHARFCLPSATTRKTTKGGRQVGRQNGCHPTAAL